MEPEAIVITVLTAVGFVVMIVLAIYFKLRVVYPKGLRQDVDLWGYKVITIVDI
jgi:hypothetical protein